MPSPSPGDLCFLILERLSFTTIIEKGGALEFCSGDAFEDEWD